MSVQGLTSLLQTEFAPAQITLEPVFGWYAIIPLALIMLASLWLTLSTSGISPRARMVLALLRLAAVAVLLLGWLRPGFVSSTERDSPGAIAVLLDRSTSMTLPSDTADRDRWQAQQDVWQRIESLTNLQIGGSKIIPYFFDSEPVAANPDHLPSLSEAFDTEPDGNVTDLGRTLSELNKMQVDPPLRGVILVGDATQTRLPPEMDATIVARQMAQRDQPILLVGIGAKGDKSQISDIAIEGMPEHYSAFIRKELNVGMVLNVQGMQSLEIDVELRLSKSREPTQSQVVASRTAIALRPNEQIPLDFRVVVEEEGEYFLEATALVKDATEQITTNNVASSFVSVREGGVKILYLEGQPVYEQLFLKRSLNESPDFDIEYVWLQERERRRWPINIPPSVKLREYDAIVFGDLDARALSQASQKQIASRIRTGAGVLFMGGYHSFDAGGYGRSELKSVFPVELSNRQQRFDAPIDSSLHIEKEIKLKPTRPHPVTTFDNEPENSRIWESLSPMDGMNRIGDPKSGSAGVQVLLESADGDPVLVQGQYGRGRVLAFAANSTWKWFTSGQQKIHQQFWRQALLWLVQREDLSEGFRIDLDKRRMRIDETPDLAIDWFGGSEEKPMPDNVRVRLFRNGTQFQTLAVNKTGNASLASKITGLDEPGVYYASLEATGNDGEDYQSEIGFVVKDESLEMASPAADWQMMKNIVSANQLAGGRLVLPEEIDDAIRFLEERQASTKVTSIEKRQLGDAAWDAWLYLALFCGLMSFEWSLRKAWQMP